MAVIKMNKQNVWWLSTSFGTTDRTAGFSSYAELKERNVLAQGFSLTGSLNQYLNLTGENQNEFLRKVNELCCKAYGTEILRRNPGRRLLNLLLIKKNDIVAVCDGVMVKGAVKVLNTPGYFFNENFMKSGFSHEIRGEFLWKDWNFLKNGLPPKTKSQGPCGIDLCHRNRELFLDLFN